jgi:hypothetical protein
MSQKSSVPQASSFVSQVLKRDNRDGNKISRRLRSAGALLAHLLCLLAAYLFGYVS